MMFQTTLGAVFVQVALTFALLIWMGTTRVGSIKRGEVKIRDIALDESGWTERCKKIGNCFHNQLELPMLFYVLVALALILRKADLILAVLAWLFVLTRLVHACIQTTSNTVPRRAQAFFVGAIILMIMWGYFAVQVLLRIP
jgi:hypothetical protein